MLKLGFYAKELRLLLGLTQKELAKKLNVTDVHISNIENDKSAPSAKLVDRYREKTGIDLYIFVWCQRGDIEMLPESIRKPAAALAFAWREQLFEQLRKRS